LINFGQRTGASNYLGYRESYRIKLCFASGNIVLNEQTIIQRGNTIKPDRMVVNQVNDLFVRLQNRVHNAKYKTIRELPTGN
jgi:hypothetical protein